MHISMIYLGMITIIISCSVCNNFSNFLFDGITNV